MTWVLAALCTILLSTMTILVLLQVFTRYCLNDPVSFTEELVRYFLIWTGFIGAAYAFGTRQHMALVYFRDKLPENKRKLLMAAIDALILLFAALFIVIGGTQLALSATREFSALLGIPRSLVYSMAPISGVLIVITQFINIYEDLTGISIDTAKGGEAK